VEEGEDLPLLAFLASAMEIFSRAAMLMMARCLLMIGQL